MLVILPSHQLIVDVTGSQKPFRAGGYGTDGQRKAISHACRQSGNAPAEIDDNGRSGRQSENNLGYPKAAEIDEKWKEMFVGRRES
jgi:hypothetical protein